MSKTRRTMCIHFYLRRSGSDGAQSEETRAASRRSVLVAKLMFSDSRFRHVRQLTRAGLATAHWLGVAACVCQRRLPWPACTLPSASSGRPRYVVGRALATGDWGSGFELQYPCEKVCVPPARHSRRFWVVLQSQRKRRRASSLRPPASFRAGAVDQSWRPDSRVARQRRLPPS